LITILILQYNYKCSWSYSVFQFTIQSSKNRLRHLLCFRWSKRFCQNTSSPKGSPKRGPSLLLAISLFISPIFGRSLSDCHFRRPLTFRSILLFNILVHNCPKPVSFDIYPVFPTWYCGPFPTHIPCMER
jgi:hypothetical protein